MGEYPVFERENWLRTMVHLVGNGIFNPVTVHMGFSSIPTTRK
jgi:hypothetical protein